MDVLQQLGVDNHGHPYHLHLLNLMWSTAGSDADLAVVRHLADQLAKSPTAYSSTICSENWRLTLIGCVCLLTSSNRSHFADLQATFLRGSMVVPQLAVTMGLLHPKEAIAFLQSFLLDPTASRRATQVVSAQNALSLLGEVPESVASAIDWDCLEQDRATIAKQVVSAHWAFWSDRERFLIH